MDDKKLKEQMRILLNHKTFVPGEVTLMPGGQVIELENNYLFDACLLIPKHELDK